MFAGYADRSTIKARRKDVHVYTVACVIAPADSWATEFIPAWEAVLRREGIRHFHMTDFESRKVEPYKSWSNERRTAFITELLEIIKGTEIVAGAVALELEAYHALTREQRSQLGHPYRFCGALCLKRLSNLLWELNAQEPTSYVFDWGDPGYGELEKVVTTLSEIEKRRLHIQSFVKGSKEEYIQLQAADVLAYEAAKGALRDIGAERLGQRKSLLSILERIPCTGYLFDKTTLNVWVQQRRDPFGNSPTKSDVL